MYHDTYCGIVKKQYLKSWGKKELSTSSIFEKNLTIHPSINNNFATNKAKRIFGNESQIDWGSFGYLGSKRKVYEFIKEADGVVDDGFDELDPYQIYAVIISEF
jgi:hypothetical protein